MLCPGGFETSVKEDLNPDKFVLESFLSIYSHMLSVDFTRPVTEADDESQTPGGFMSVMWECSNVFPVLSAAPADT